MITQDIGISKSKIAVHSKNKYGQYFTPKLIAEFMVELAELSPHSKILEPACGEGVFLETLIERGYKDLTAYEIDNNLSKEYDFINYESFITANINRKFDVVIGNPPYIRWKNLEQELKDELINSYYWNKYFNSLCDYLYIFILKSIELLENGGQLIFICPEYWMNTTHSISLRNYMVSNGYFESIYHFNETPIFDSASVSVLIFKYVKNNNNKKNYINVVKYFKNRLLTSSILKNIKDSEFVSEDIKRFKVKQFEMDKRWLLSDKSEISEIECLERSCKGKGLTHNIDLFDTYEQIGYDTIGDICDIGNGLVSGLDKAFQLNGQNLNNTEKQNSIKVIKAKDIEPFTYSKTTNYIFVNNVKDEEELQENFPNYYNKLNLVKDKLNKRYNYNKTINYWQWVFLRNYNLFNSDKSRIFVPCKERISNKDYFRFTYVEKGIFPTQDVTAIFPKPTTKESIYYILAFLNNERIFNWLKNKGIVKGSIIEFSEKPIASIPFRKIRWNLDSEVEIHNEIEALTKSYIKRKQGKDMERIKFLFNKLLA